jgi:hypothetical protein
MIDVLPYAVGLGVVIKKLSASESSVVEPGSWDDWIPGQENSLSLPLDYKMRGSFSHQ